MPNELVPEASAATAAHVIASETLQQQILEAILPKEGSRSGGQKSADSLARQLSRVVSGYAMKVEGEDELENYTYYVPAENPLEIINLVITADGDSLLEGSIFTYQMTPDFAQDFNQFTTDFRFFTGTLTVSPLARLADVYYHGIQKNGEDDGTDCFEWIFSQRPDRPNGGGGGSDGSDSGPTVSTGSGPIGGSFGGLCAVINSIPCSCADHEYGDDTCVCGTGNSSGHPAQEVIVGFEPCHELPGDQLNNDSTNDSIDKNLDPEDCPELLSSIGVVARELNYPQAGSRLAEAVELAVSETCFSLPAVMHIIDLSTFASCTAGGVISGPDCVVRQIEAYLNGLGIINQDPGSGPTINSFSGLPHDQLAAFLNAAVAGEGNENILNGISLIRRNLSNSYVSNTLSESILNASLLYRTDPLLFEENALSFISLLSKTKGELANNYISWLVVNPDVLNRIVDLDILNETVRDLAVTYISLYNSDEDFRILADGEFETIPPALWVLIREIGVEVAIELVKKHLPGVSDYSNIIDAINDARQGDILGFLGEVIDIVKRKFPALAAIDLAIDSINLGTKASRAFRAFKRLERFGDTAITKLLEVVGDKAGSLLGKIVYTNNRTGIQLNDVGIPSTFRDDLIEKLRESLNVEGPLPEGPNLKFVVSPGTPQSFDIIWQPTSSTTGEPSINFRKDGFVVKLRF